MTASAKTIPGGAINHVGFGYWSPQGSNQFLRIYDSAPSTGELLFEVDAANKRVIGHADFYAKSPYVGGLDANYTASVHDEVIVFANTTTRNCNLPAANTVPGKRYTIIKSIANVARVNINPTVVGAHDSALMAQHDFLTVMSDGTNYITITDGLRAHVAHIANTSAQTIPHNTDTQLAFNTTVNSTGGMEDTANNRILIRRGGQYTISAYVSFNNMAANSWVELNLRVNGTNVNSLRLHGSNAIAFIMNENAVTINAAANDLITVTCTHTHGSDRDTTTTQSVRPKLIAVEQR